MLRNLRAHPLMQVNLDVMDGFDAESGITSGHPAWLNDLRADDQFHFGRMSRLGANTEDDSLSRLAAARLVAEVTKTFIAGALKVGFSLDEISRWGAFGPLAPFVGKTDLQRQVEANMQKIAQDIAAWSTIYLQWALDGQRNGMLGSTPGSPYTWKQWVDFAAVLNGSIRTQTAVAWDDSEAKLAIDAIIASLKVPFDPDAWPVWVKVLLGLGSAAVIGVYVVPLVKAAMAKRGASKALSGRRFRGNGPTTGNGPTRTEVRSPTRTSTSTWANTRGNVTVTGGAGAGATTVTIKGRGGRSRKPRGAKGRGKR